MIIEQINGNINNNIIKNDRLSLVEICLLSISIAVSNYGDSISSTAIGVMSCIYPILLSIIKPTKSIYVVAFILINTKTMSIFGISASTVITSVVSLILIIKEKKPIPICVFAFISYGAVQGLLYADANSILTNYVKVALLILYLNYFIPLDNKKCYMRWNQTIDYAIIGAVVTCLSAIIFNQQLFDETRFAISSDAGENYTGIIMSILAVYCILMYQTIRNKKSYIAFFLLFSVIGILSGSRTFIIVYIFGIVAITIAVLSSFNLNKSLKIIVLLVTICFAAFIIINASEELKNDIVYLVNKFVDPKNNDLSNGRIDIWMSYIKAFKENPIKLLFGVGSYTNLGINKMAHNMIIEMVTCYGIVGMLVFIVSCYRLFRKGIAKTNNQSMSNWILRVTPIACIFAAGMVSHTLTSLPNMILIFISILTFRCIPMVSDGTILSQNIKNET